jgi:class 3 adenylate cyclase
MSRFAAAALSAAAATPIDPATPGLGAVLLRVGLHSGPCSAGVVGRNHPKFTLFGDTVNTAARMEQTSVPGRVQCSATTAALIRAQDPAIPLLSRGPMDVKGKGMMETFWVGGDNLLRGLRAGGGGQEAGGGGETGGTSAADIWAAEAGRQA